MRNTNSLSFTIGGTTLKYDKDTINAFSKNPLGIISLFLFLIYGVAALVVGTGSFDILSQRNKLNF